MTSSLLRSSVGSEQAPPVAVFLAFIFSAIPASAFGSPVSPGGLSIATTTQSIGIDWRISGDTNHNATATVEFRASGVAAWTQAMPLVRVDSPNANSLAGSILFLEPATQYDIRVSVTDPDGGAESRTITATTEAVPAMPTASRTLHVIPGSGGGNGSSQNPYQGLETAWSNALPGDHLLLHSGYYGGVSDTNGRSGTPAQHIVLRPAGDGEVVVSYLQLFAQSNLWIEGLSFQYDGSSDTALYSSLLNPGYDNGFRPMSADVNNIVLIGNRFEGYKHAVRAGPRTSRWYIADNMIVGDKQLGISGTESFDGEGIELGHGDNHEVLYNSITRVADGVSFPGANCDIYGNDIFDVTDDGIELDTGEGNTRAWRNRIHNASHNGIGFQPQSGAPWYIIRNQIVNVQESVFKFRDADRFVAVNNTFVNWGDVLDHWSHQLFRGITRNNLWITVNNGRIWRRGSEGMSWQTDLDYDGFDWGTNSEPFEVNGVKYADLGELQAATGQESNGIRMDAPSCLASLDVPGPPPLTTVPPQFMTLNASCNAVDAGIAVPNISDDYLGAAPDLGAYEFGQADPHYGPRPVSTDPGNRPPTADAGSDQTANEETTIQASGSRSLDPDGDPLTFFWSQVSGAQATIVTANQASTNIVLPAVNASELLVFRLTVTDTANASDSDDLEVTVNDVATQNSPPVASAGVDTSGDESTEITLNGASSSDPDGETLTYRWAQVSGPTATMSNSDQVSATVTLPEVSSTTTLEFELTVSDPSGAADTDRVVVTVNNVTTSGGGSSGSNTGGGGSINLFWLVLCLAALRSVRRDFRRFRRPGSSTGEHPC